MKLTTLIKRAQRYSSMRGHRLKWQTYGDTNAIGGCRCGAYVQCLTRPDPNQINIGGTIFRCDCPITRPNTKR